LKKRRNALKKALRAAALAAAKAALRPREAPLPPAEEIRKILIIKLWAVGEYLMATPAFAALRDLFPAADVTLLTGAAAAPLANAAPFFDRVWTVPEQIFVKKRLGRINRLRRLIAKEDFDVVVTFHFAWEFTTFSALTGIPHRVGVDRDGDGFAHTVKVPRVRRRHQVEEYFDLARACGAPGAPGPMVVVPGEEAKREAEHFLAEPAFRGRPLLVVAPGGGVNPKTRMEAKRWPAAYYVELVNVLKTDFEITLVGGPSDVELNAGVAAATGVPDATSKTSLPALYVLLKSATAFVGNDSAPMHVAAAAGAPTIAFFGPTDPARNGPWHTPSLILSYEIDCRPCYEDGYFPACDHRRCLVGVTPEEAAGRIHDFLDSLGARC
jgi:lipopolysaccharide heptosyltransferase II